MISPAHVTGGGGGDLTIQYSKNGTSWSSISYGGDDNFYAVTYGKNIFVTLGESGNIFPSSDGISWDNRTSVTTISLSGVAFGNNTFVTVGGNVGKEIILT